MDGVKINARQPVSDLGIIIRKDLKLIQQVAVAWKKAYLEIGNIKRSFISCSPQFLNNMFKLFLRPHSEYSVQM